MRRPALRADATKRREAIGNERSERIRNISDPTAPVAPTTATDGGMNPGYRVLQAPGCDSRRITSSESRKRSCTARTALTTSASRTTHEMRIDDVEIISMLTPDSDKAENIVAATPGWLRIPAPTSETFPIPSSYVTPA